jgi:hypothetical protein
LELNELEKFCCGEEDSPAQVLNVPSFREGDYNPQGKYSAADVQELADTYDPTWIEAPLTLDHRQDGPAYGWTTRAFAAPHPADGKMTLFCDFSLLWMGEYLWESGAYRYRSIELWRDIGLKDGKAKGHYLKAVTLLGAATPAVAGLGKVFSAIESTSSKLIAKMGGLPKAWANLKTTYNFSESLPVCCQGTSCFQIPWEKQEASTEAPEPTTHFNKEGHNMDPKKEKGQEGQEPVAPQVFSLTAEQHAQFQEAMKALPALQTQVKNLSEQNEKLSKDLDSESSRAFKAGESSRFEKVAVEASTEGKLTVPQRNLFELAFHALPPDSEESMGTVHFGKVEGKDVEKKLTPRQALLELMSMGATVVDVTGKPQSRNSSNTKAFSGPSRDEDPAAFSAAVTKRAKELLKEKPAVYNGSFKDAAVDAEKELLGEATQVG